MKKVFILLLTLGIFISCASKPSISSTTDISTKDENIKIANKTNYSTKENPNDERDLYFGEKNGKLLSYEENNDFKIIERTFSYQPDQWWLGIKDIFTETTEETKIGILKNPDVYNFNKIKYFEPKSGDDKDFYTVWANITIPSKNITGWINLGLHNKNSLPYTSKEYTYLKEIDVKGRKWHIRNLKGYLTTYKKTLDIRDNPGFKGTNVTTTLITATGNEETGIKYLTPNLHYKYITEEEEKDHKSKLKIKSPWVYIEYQGVSGWVFGGDLEAARGGIKFKTDIEKFMFEIVNKSLV